MKRAPRQKAMSIVAPDLRRYVDDTPGEGFLEWCEATAEKMVAAKTPEERAAARIMRAVVTAIIESGNAAQRQDGVGLETATLYVPRCALFGVVTALMSVFRSDLPTAELRRIVVAQLDDVLAIMAPGKTIGGK
ncbi:MAG: hypothetical protein KF897_17720 [Opitutaceae bacterium]|nr:hypothetical protein [Opitutaceae bacterium]